MKNNRIGSLSGLRYLFIVGIFLHHTSYNGLDSFGFQYGYIGVSYFLILSGFLLTMSWNYRTHDLSYISFFISRLIKVYPTAIICLLLLAIPLLLQHCNCWKYVTYHALMLQGWYEPCMYSLNHPAWFLSSLFFCYSLFPLLIKLIKCKKYYFYLIFFILLCFYLWTVFHSERAEYYCYFFPPFRLLDFMIGMILYFIYDKINQISNSDITKRQSIIIEIAAVMVLMLFGWYKDVVPSVIARDSWYWIPMSVIIFCFAITNQNPGWLSQFFSSRTLTILGDSTMCFFLSHAIVIHYVEFFVRVNSALTVLMLLMLSTIISILLHFCFEIPVTKWLNKRFYFLLN